LVLKAQIGTYDIDRVFMDAGSGISLIYAKALRAMHISLEFLKPTDCSFHGIVPGSANDPLGRIALNVCFGNRQNYRREKLDFEIMDWPSQYQAILGRPAFSQFMAVPHYMYLVIKMPVPNGIITIKGSFKLSDLCDKEFHKIAQNFGMIANYGEPKGKSSKRDYRRHKTTRRTSSGAGSEKTMGTIIRPNGSCSGRREYLHNIDSKRTEKVRRVE
jgi:hypothetical protein